MSDIVYAAQKKYGASAKGKLSHQRYARSEKGKARYRRYYHNRQAVRMAAFKAGPCTDCGNTFPSECMDFDHVKGKKKYNVSLMSHRAIRFIKAEIAKCDLVCSNCHRIRTKARRRVSCQK